MHRPLLIALCAALVGCGDTTTPSVDGGAPDANTPDAAASDASAPDASAPDVAPPVEPVESAVFRHLLGRFDSAAQALSDARYLAIRVEACRVAAPLLGERVLYLEQSRTGMAPYRQRLYVIERDGADDRAVSRVFELNNPASYVGLCADPSRETFTPDDVIERAGCAVHLTRVGDRFEGGTDGRACESTLMGASYATSEVVLRATGFSSWDRGFNAAATQVWGATAGPYLFARRGPIEPWSASDR